MPELFSAAGSASAESGMPSAVSEGADRRQPRFSTTCQVTAFAGTTRQGFKCQLRGVGSGSFTVAMVPPVRLPRGFEMH